MYILPTIFTGTYGHKNMNILKYGQFNGKYVPKNTLNIQKSRSNDINNLWQNSLEGTMKV